MSENKNILLVLKKRDHSNRLASMLRVKGFLVDQAFRGIQATHLFEQKEYSIIFSDFKFLDMYATEIFMLYKSSPGFNKNAKLTITGLPNEIESIRDEIIKNKYEFIRKPINDKNLVNYFELAFQNKKAA